MYYLDSSALVKLYVREPGSRRLAAWVGVRAETGVRSVAVSVSRLGFPETMSAITRRRNEGSLSPAEAMKLWNAVLSDFMSGAQTYVVIDPTETIVGRAAILVATYGLRGYDAVHLASALRLQMDVSDQDEVVFVSADGRLNRAAAAERLSTADPTT
ncbi:MAG TPA: type II toxin-antitoxin system VapC family toxin [Longimicrobium sp.]|nr:type II toxin-antitoxin system VapC family toxin [Longimicrobium sp.]